MQETTGPLPRFLYPLFIRDSRDNQRQYLRVFTFSIRDDRAVIRDVARLIRAIG